MTELKDSKFMTAKEKQLALKQWELFLRKLSEGVKGEQLFSYFPDRLYKHLSLHCSFIAHYDRRGFFQTYFDEPEDTVKFIGQFDMDKGNVSVEYGTEYWLTDPEMSDINQEMVVIAEKYKKPIYAKRSEEQKQTDIARAQLLLAKHGISLGKGWKAESARHSLARKGIKTGRKKKW